MSAAREVWEGLVGGLTRDAPDDDVDVTAWHLLGSVLAVLVYLLVLVAAGVVLWLAVGSLRSDLS